MLGRQVMLTGAAERDLDAVPEPDRARVLSALRALRAGDPGLDLRKLSGSQDRWRLRVGDGRVILRTESGGTVYVLRVLPRGRAYR